LAIVPVEELRSFLNRTSSDSHLRATREDFRMLKFPSALVAVSGMLLTLATQTAAQTVAPPNLPAAIMCYAEPDQSWRVGYLYKVNKNGDAEYISANGKLSATLNAKGVVEAPTNRPAGVDCYGKTLDELRSKGRVMEFKPTK
jgi:hypothetical protein